MHAKSDSEVTIDVDHSSQDRSPRRTLYYVQSPSSHDVERTSYRSSPLASPHHYYYHWSSSHHSHESSTNPRNPAAWKKLHNQLGTEDDDDDEKDDGESEDSGHNVKLCVYFFLLFVALFSVFSLILWGASRTYKPKVFLKNIVFEDLNIQAGSDATGVPTELLSLNSTVKIFYRNPATFFGVHVTSTPLQLYFYQLPIASGQIQKFYQSRKSQRKLTVVVQAYQVPLYGAVSAIGDARGERKEKVVMPLNLTLVVRSSAHILGSLVKSKFYRTISCSISLRGNKLGKPLNLTDSCLYN
ncbi:Late embryogenesis abundant protein [Quillaja saponaria]|uniref:Late embryogenesis abundant protein n=1 Tax=Quillaja saponaria TaxID=32244 RepID=A0AAD7M0U4_QUISA|nr:Late embryogenesis abundant protein [Quillaja saponaria]